MTVLLTQCPHCQTSFRVSSAQLNAANGLVRCGSCLGVFSAVSNEIRVKHPDGYVVEELDSYDDEPVDESGASESSVADDAGNNNEWQDDDPSVSLGDMQLDDDIDSDLDDDDIDQPANDVIDAKTDQNHEAHALFDSADEHDEVSEQASSSPPLPTDEPYAAAPEEFEPETLVEEAIDSPGFDAAQTGNEREEPESEVPPDLEMDDDSIEVPIYRHTPPPLASRVRPAADKEELHAHLSELTDDDALDPLDDGSGLDSLEELPVTIESRDNLRRRLTQAALTLAAIMLLLALPVPWLYVHRDTLSTHRRFSFMAPLVCEVFTCQPPPAGVATSLYSQQLLVRSHPKYQDALEVSFVFHNDSTLPQPFPNLELAFSDVNNALLANRLFTPQEYLPPELRQLREMPANSSVQIALEVGDPGPDAVNYTVKLHSP